MMTSFTIIFDSSLASKWKSVWKKESNSERGGGNGKDEGKGKDEGDGDRGDKEEDERKNKMLMKKRTMSIINNSFKFMHIYHVMIMCTQYSMDIFTSKIVFVKASIDLY